MFRNIHTVNNTKICIASDQLDMISSIDFALFRFLLPFILFIIINSLTLKELIKSKRNSNQINSLRKEKRFAFILIILALFFCLFNLSLFCVVIVKIITVATGAWPSRHPGCFPSFTVRQHFNKLSLFPSVFPLAVRKQPFAKMSFGRMTQNIRNVPTSRSPFCLKHNLELHSKVFVFRSISSFLNQVCIGLIIAQRWTTGFQTKRSWVWLYSVPYLATLMVYEN